MITFPSCGLYLSSSFLMKHLKRIWQYFHSWYCREFVKKLYRLTGNPSTGLIDRISDLLAINVSWDVSKTTCNPDYLALKRPGVLKP